MKAWLAEFRHPLKNDTNNRPGEKTRKGLCTENETVAAQLVDELNDLLRNEALWSLGGRDETAKPYDTRVVDIFYSEIEPRVTSARQFCDRLLPLPTSAEGYARVVLPKLSHRRLRELPQPVWLGAYALRAAGSTFDRKMRVERMYERWVPVPDARGDTMAFEFMEEVKSLLTVATSDV
ncbi:hypothetical protein QCE73_12470 [Caballeronia sp. LZ029]|uniref:hypothetical protein n=1 Tax=Caballeronia sp. LZ029 TaxID=3038564 RepID=UPI002862C26B|nr:hypothetical protein [Caballeronia sp. LZ029]MDR5743966.1 hypothetical protein [Caballeronia sp. LZ029]